MTPVSFSRMEYTIPAGTKIGHVHLKVSDLDRAEAFYLHDPGR